MVNSNITLKLFIVLLLLTITTGCSAISHGVAMLRSTEHFSVSQTDKRILYEEDAEDISKKIEDYINNAISVVEINQHLKFKEKIKIIICASPKSFTHLTSSGTTIPAKAFNGKVFLSATLLREKPEILQPIVAHELSHLLYIQNLGLYRFSKSIPRWFSEGIAEFASEKGSVSIDDNIAIKQLNDGNHFLPSTTGNLFFPFKAISPFTTTKEYFSKVPFTDIKTKMQILYKQSHIFIKFLEDYDSIRFDKMLLSLAEGAEFQDAFDNAYKISLMEGWTLFLDSLKRSNEANCSGQES